LLRELRDRKLTRLFNFNGTIDYVNMLERQIEGSISSWAVRWYASAFLNGMHTLYPGESLVTNIGFDGSGTHCDDSSAFAAAPSGSYVPVPFIPVRERSGDRKAFERFFRSSYGTKKSPIRRLIRKLVRILRK